MKFMDYMNVEGFQRSGNNRVMAIIYINIYCLLM